MAACHFCCHCHSVDDDVIEMTVNSSISNIITVGDQHRLQQYVIVDMLQASASYSMQTRNT